MKYPQSVIDEAVAHAKRQSPSESVGFFYLFKGRMKYWEATNISKSQNDFEVSHEEFAQVEQRGEVLALVHSHPNANALPSILDQKSHAASGLDWLIVGLKNDAVELHFMPSVEPLELYGRKYEYGITDCYSFLRDWYKEHFNIEFKDFERGGQWWNDGSDFYVERFPLLDLVEVDTLELGDVLLMTLGATVANHIAIYVDDNQIEHHLNGRLSCREVYGQFYRDRTTHVLRHKSRITND